MDRRQFMQVVAAGSAAPVLPKSDFGKEHFKRVAGEIWYRARRAPRLIEGDSMSEPVGETGRFSIQYVCRSDGDGRPTFKGFLWALGTYCETDTGLVYQWHYYAASRQLELMWDERTGCQRTTSWARFRTTCSVGGIEKMTYFVTKTTYGESD